MQQGGCIPTLMVFIIIPLLLLMIYLLINEAGVMWRGVINGRAMAETVSTQLSLITGGTPGPNDQKMLLFP